MNKTFSIIRFRRLFYKHSIEHYKNYLMALTVLFGVMILGGGFLVYMVDFPLDNNFQAVIFWIILVLAGCIFTSGIFADLGDRKKIIASLTLPSTHLEKFMVAWIYSFLIFLVVYCATFYLIAIFAVNIVNAHGHHTRLLNLFEKPVLQLTAVYAFLHAIALWGAIYFEKLHFVKTAFVFFICFGILVFFNKVVLGLLLHRSVDASPPFSYLRFSDNGEQRNINLVSQDYLPIQFYLVAVVAIIFWIAAYHRLKEKQA